MTTFSDTITFKLQQLGFSEKEAAVYIACLDLGAVSAVSTIASRAKLQRTTAYDILRNLEQKGVVIAVKSKKNRYYEALPPEKVIAYLKEQSAKYARLALDAQEMLPQLNARRRSHEDRPRVYFYEGEDGLRRVYEETLSSTGEILAYACDQTNQESLPWYFPKYYKRRAAKKIPIRAIFPDSQKNRDRHALDKEELRESRLVPRELLNFTPEINFFDNKIMIADWKEKLGIIIESREIAKAFKQTFELAWEAAEKYQKETEHV